MNNSKYLKIISKSINIPKTKLSQFRGNRNDVHKKGWWHYGVLTNLIRIDSNGNLQILIQKRSNTVDIAKVKYDQSLATQILFSDKNKRESFYRGIKEELNINSTDIEFVEFLPKSNFYIIKEYIDENNIINKEKIFLFVAKLKKKINIKSNCNRVISTKWIDWEQFVNDILKHPSNYTKTVRFFIKNVILRNRLEKFMINFINNNIDKKVNSSKLNILYVSPKNNKDTIQNLQ